MSNPTKLISNCIGSSPIVEPNNSVWGCFDDGGVEVEVGEFLYGLIRAKKPDMVLETGLYSGISAMYMALALRDNDRGRLDTVEFEQVHAKRAKERLVKLGVQDRVTIHLKDSRNFEPPSMYDLMLLDTEPDIRFYEMVKFYSNLKPGGFVFIHDLPRSMCQGNHNPDRPDFKHWPFGEVPHAMRQLVRSRELTPIHIGSARGMMGFYKPHEEDYKWT